MLIWVRVCSCRFVFLAFYFFLFVHPNGKTGIRVRVRFSIFFPRSASDRSDSLPRSDFLSNLGSDAIVSFQFECIHQIGILSIVVIDVRDHRETERKG